MWCVAHCTAYKRYVLLIAAHIFLYQCRRRKRRLPTLGAKLQPRAPYTRVRLCLACSQARPGASHLAPSISTDLLMCCKQSSQHNALYTAPPCGTISAAVWDLSSAELPPGLAPRSADILVLVFVLSALHP